MAVTQKDIAQHLGISRISVARALNGYHNVPEGTRKRILDAARELGYGITSNREARALVARRYGKRVRSNIIAVTWYGPFFDEVPITQVPFYREIISGIEEEVAHRGLDLFFCTYSETHQPRLINEGGVDGLICLGHTSSASEQLDLPRVVFSAEPPRNSNICTLVPDDKGGMRLATQHLIELGHEKIGCLSFPPTLWPQIPYRPAVRRILGYKCAMKMAGLEVTPNMLITDISEPNGPAGFEAMNRLLSQCPDLTAVVCFNDLIAMGAIEALRQRGKGVPQDFSVVGFDDMSRHYDSAPQITSIAYDRTAMGRKAVEVICKAHSLAANDARIFSEIFPVHLAEHNSAVAPPLIGNADGVANA